VGRGLSTLQKTILRTAYRGYSRRQGKNRQTGADAYYAEILHEHYGWQPVLGPLRSKGDAAAAAEEDGCSFHHGPHFDREQIGHKPYKAAQAALSRAVLRLVRRGLVDARQGARSRWSGVNLTEAGVKEARRLCGPPPEHEGS
jgi:hypothetical protein